MSFLFLLAARNLWRNTRRSAITLCAIILGVVVVLVLKGLADGFTELVVSSIVDGRTGALQVHRAGYFKDREALPLELSMPQGALEERLKRVRGVKGITPRIQFSGLLSDGATQSTFLGTAIDPSSEKRACPNWGKDLVPGGQDLEPKDYGEALLGIALAKSLHAKVAESRLTLSAASPTGRMNAMELGVKGVTETAIRFENKRVVTVPLRFAQDLLGMPGQVTEYAIAVERLDALPSVAQELRAALGPEYEVHTWQQVQPYLYGVVRRQETIVLISAVIFFLAIVTGIANAMATSVLERTREVGTMLAFGMRRRRILALFMLEALIIGAIAGLIGAALGRFAVWVIALFGLPVRAIVNPGDALIRPVVEPSFIGVVVLGAIAIAVVAAALPALKASRLSPSDALRVN